MNRRPLGKRLRFEVFKRDGFRCVYCGATPVQSALHVDHVEAVAEGGDDDSANLVTACASCNLGKSSVPLDERALRSQRTTEELREQAEQIEEYLAVQQETLKAKEGVAQALFDYWADRCAHKGGAPALMRPRLRALAEEWPFEKLVEAVDIVAARRFASATDEARYFQGILRNWRKDGAR